VPRAFAAWLLSLSLILPSVVAAQGASTVEAFEAAFRSANASKDFRRLEQLVWWEQTKPKARENMRSVLHQGFGHSIHRIDVDRFSSAKAIYPPQNPNLKPTHVFTVWSVTGRDRLGTQITGTFYTLGRKDGRFYFVISDNSPIMAVHYE
jgi:hypothetical protein